MCTEMCLCVKSKEQHSDSWQTEQNQNNLGKGKLVLMETVARFALNSKAAFLLRPLDTEFM